MDEKELENKDHLLNSGKTNDPEGNAVKNKIAQKPRKPDGHKALLIILIGIFVCILAAVIAVGISFALKHKKKGEPHLKFLPKYDDGSLIHFEQGKPETYDKYKNIMDDFLTNYESDNMHGEHFLDCSNGRPQDFDDSACVFRLYELGYECTRDTNYGYDEGMPCVALMLEKVNGWSPMSYSNDTMAPPKDSGLGNNWDSDHIAVTCEGKWQADRENIGRTTVFPVSGFNNIYFPYKDSMLDYRSPLVMVKFNRPKNGVIIQVECKAWAQNIDHSQGEGVVSFNILVD